MARESEKKIISKLEMSTDPSHIFNHGRQTKDCVSNVLVFMEVYQWLKWIKSRDKGLTHSIKLRP